MNVTALDFYLVLPVLIVFFTPIAIMTLTVVQPKFEHSLMVALLGIVLALAVLPFFLNEPALPLGRFFVTDGFSRICQVFFLSASIAVVIFSREWLVQCKERTTEFSILLLISLVGAMTLVMSSHFLSFFVSLELLSIPLYAMIGYQVQKKKSLEAGLKYILLAGFSIAILLFGTALLYKDTGTLEFEGIFELTQLTGQGFTPLGWVGFILFFSGIAFKIGLVPFHMWLPDVYEGAPIAVTAYLTTVSKGAVLFFLLRFVQKIGVDNLQSVGSMMATLAVMSMFLGSIMALKQQNLKRLLAYSSIAQVGYMMIGVLSMNAEMVSATLFYVFAYSAAILCALGVLAIHTQNSEEKEGIKSLEGLFFSNPLAAIGLTVSLLSFTGLPLTAGFIGKFFILVVGIDYFPLVISLIASSAIGFYAYFKVILLMANRGSVTIVPQKMRFSLAHAAVISLACIVILLGMIPAMLTGILSNISS